MRKFLYGAAIVLAATTLTACGGEKEEKDVKTNATTSVSSTTASGQTQEAEGSSTTSATQATTSATQPTTTQKKTILEWKSEDIKALAMKELEVSQVAITEKVSIKIAKTPFDYSVSDIKAKLTANKFISDNYVLAVYSTDTAEGQTYSDVGNKLKYDITDCISGIKKADATNKSQYYNDFTVSFNRDTSLYSNYHRVYISFSNVDVSEKSDFQTNVYSVVNDIVGEEYAKYLVYAKDLDGKNSNNKTISDDINMSEYITTSSGTYLASRNYSENKDGTISLSFVLMVSSSGIKNSFKYYDGGYVSVVDSLPYKLESMVPANFGDTDYRNIDTFADKYMTFGIEGGGVYTRTLLNGADVKYLVSDTGVKVTTYSTTTARGSADYAKIVSPELEIKYVIAENDGGIFEMEYNITGDAGHIGNKADKDESYAKLVEVQKEQIAIIFPELDLSDVSYDVMKAKESVTYSKDVTVMVQGVEMTGKITFRVGGSAMDTYLGEYKINLSYSK